MMLTITQIADWVSGRIDATTEKRLEVLNQQLELRRQEIATIERLRRTITEKPADQLART